MKNHPLTQFVVIVAVLAYLQSASAQLPKVQRFVDTLTSPDFDNDLNNSASDRQSGLDAPIRYSSAAAGVFQIETGPDGLIFYPESNMTAVSPDKNFNQGGSFQLEFEVNPGLDDASHSSDDWAAVTFGSSNRNVFVNGSTGMGILFRNNGNIQVFDGASAIYSGDGGFDGGLPKDDYFSVRIAVTLPAFDALPRLFLYSSTMRKPIFPERIVHRISRPRGSLRTISLWKDMQVGGMPGNMDLKIFLWRRSPVSNCPPD
ncbi:MAG: hypothetical protein LR011_07740 [Verrucomicrobia bacterium]|nr:hypothetical protein [Verrucomicrobiota bacterium]